MLKHSGSAESTCPVVRAQSSVLGEVARCYDSEVVMTEKSSALATALAIACITTAGAGAATADPAPALGTEQRTEAMAGFSALPCLPWILPPAVNVREFLICLA
ncbi:hypothetical protein ACFYTS_06770 [Nocardia sp. NPDC004151]|uniref:hypothetical protein n=2 Tax=unclassified Nocardia TaxID=2637762 RepID=UPI0036CE8B4E